MDTVSRLLFSLYVFQGYASSIIDMEEDIV
jgi:hypothetical protein